MPSLALVVPLISISALIVAALRGWGLFRASSLSLALYLIASTFTPFTVQVPYVRVVDSALKGVEILAVVLASLTLVEMMREDGVLEDIVHILKETCQLRGPCLVGLSVVATGAFESVASFGTPATLVGPLLVEAGLSKTTAAAAALVGHAPFGVFAAFGVPILVTSGVSGIDPKKLSFDVALCIAPSLLVLPYAVAETADLRVSKVLLTTMGIMTTASLLAVWWVASPSIVGPLLVLGVASGFLWYLRVAGEEARIKVSNDTIKGMIVYGLVVVGIGVVKALDVKWVQPWMLLWVAVLLYATPRWTRMVGALIRVLRKTWEELLSIVLLMVLGTLIAHSELPSAIRPYAGSPLVTFLVGFMGEMVVGSTTAVMATFASGTPYPEITLAGAACAAAACPYNVAVAAAAVRCHEKRVMRRSLLGSMYLTVPTLAWCTMLWIWGAMK
ncbi:L-lactate permease [Methanopyrus kandleri]|uniref:L-lactate permease n=1 Tax=Methanopyrus kandleri TaxID=2320 RepID=A0A832TIX7_9EURY|nr:L-lactate permease [Methanopyrus kandleri]HII70903.1 L-lactate permease [Methanopyrus kandleri]